MEEKYKSLEQRIYDSEVGQRIKDFSIGLIKGTYGGAVTLFRLPTFARKTTNQQTLINKIDIGQDCLGAGFLLGSFLGMATSVGIIANEASKENYIPLIVLAGTNLLFAAYEFGRFPKSKEEYKKLNFKDN